MAAPRSQAEGLDIKPFIIIKSDIHRNFKGSGFEVIQGLR